MQKYTAALLPAVLIAVLTMGCQDERSPPVAPEDMSVQAAKDRGVVKTVNTLTGDGSIVAGDNVSVTRSDHTTTIAATRDGPTEIGYEVVERRQVIFNVVEGQLHIANVQVLCPTGKRVLGGGGIYVGGTGGLDGPRQAKLRGSTPVFVIQQGQTDVSDGWLAQWIIDLQSSPGGGIFQYQFDVFAICAGIS